MRTLLPCSLLLIPALALEALVGACGDDSPGTPDAGIEGSSCESGGGTHDAEVDAGPPPIRCSQDELAANDKTDGGALEITFNTGANPAQYKNRCATVKLGASVTFAGGFAQHPLEPAGGDSPNPIPYTASDPAGSKVVVTMSRAGTFGFQCEFHPVLMFGAIKVVP